METITIDGKTYKLVPLNPFESHEEGIELSTSTAREKARLYKGKYRDYKNISEEELISRIIKVDQMSEWEYCKYSILNWTNWEELYNAVSTQINCPYKSLGQFQEKAMELVKETFDRKISIETGFIRVKYYEATDEDLPEIILEVVLYGSSHVIGEENRDYLLPFDNTDD